MILGVLSPFLVEDLYFCIIWLVQHFLIVVISGESEGNLQTVTFLVEVKNSFPRDLVQDLVSEYVYAFMCD